MQCLAGGKKMLPYGIPKESISEDGSVKPKEKKCNCEQVNFHITHCG
jgi:hypothetical protein